MEQTDTLQTEEEVFHMGNTSPVLYEEQLLSRKRYLPDAR